MSEDKPALVVHSGKRIIPLGAPREFEEGGERVVSAQRRTLHVAFEVTDPADGSVWVVDQAVTAQLKGEPR